MSHCRLRDCDRFDFTRFKMNTMSKHGFRCEQTALLVHMRVIARTHKQMVHFFDLLSVFRQVGLYVSVESSSQFSRCSHHLFRACYGKPRTERVLQPAVLGAMPFPA